MPAGRPPKFNQEETEEIYADLEAWIDKNDDPAVIYFCSEYTKYRVNKDYINNHEEFSELRKRSIQKQEAYLVRNATTGKINPAVSIFRLKQPQHGYKDKQEVDQKNTGELTVKIVNYSDNGSNTPV